MKVYFLKQVARREYFNKEIYLPPVTFFLHVELIFQAPQLEFNDNTFFSRIAANEEIIEDSISSQDLSDGFLRNELIYVSSSSPKF